MVSIPWLLLVLGLFCVSGGLAGLVYPATDGLRVGDTGWGITGALMGAMGFWLFIGIDVVVPGSIADH
jgi:hypothetical protein